MSFDKVLWRHQPYADNHVPESFLSELRTNSDIARPSVLALMLASLRVSTAVLRVAGFAIVYTHLLSRRIDAELVLAAIVVWNAVLTVCTGRRGMMARVLGKMVVALVLLAVSPVLRTLTEATTSDSIWALAAMLFGAHLVLADYAERGLGSLQDTLSFNAAISASVVLASRLDDDTQCFTMLALAITLFAPHQHAPRRPATRVLHFVSLYCAVVVGGWAGVVVWVTLGVGFISLVCPVWMRYAQAWKMEIKGPWDVARPVLSATSPAYYPRRRASPRRGSPTTRPR